MEKKFKTEKKQTYVTQYGCVNFFQSFTYVEINLNVYRK